MKKIIILCIVFLIFLGLSGCEKSVTPPDDLAVPDSAEAGDEPDIEPEQGIVYRNEKLGFELTFPESWRGWYVINEMNENVIEVAFYGKSKTSTVEFFDKFDIRGRHMFFVGNETFADEPFLDSVEEIGKVDAVKFYYGTRTDCAVCVLSDVETFSEDEKEIALAKADLEKAMQMLDDVNDILKTFKSIK
jgi:hypothetical protein